LYVYLKLSVDKNDDDYDYYNDGNYENEEGIHSFPLHILLFYTQYRTVAHCTQYTFEHNSNIPCILCGAIFTAVVVNLL
jgi:hypothetical protein